MNDKNTKKGANIKVKAQELFEIIAKDSHATVEEVKLDLTERIDIAWNNSDSKFDIFHTYFKNKKPSAEIFILSLNRLVALNDKIQEIIEDISDASEEHILEITDTLDCDEIKDPIIYFLAILNCLEVNKPIIKLIKEMIEKNE